jgi:hypothetical protein
MNDSEEVLTSEIMTMIGNDLRGEDRATASPPRQRQPGSCSPPS